MADQKRWWKLWCTAPSDELLQRIPPAHRWAWAVLGAYTKSHGTSGRVTVSETNMVLAAEMGLACMDMIGVIKTMPHIVVEECKNRHGEFSVTWQNWVKYQEDSTQAERAKASRSKRRGEERRREESLTAPDAHAAGADNGFSAWPEEWGEIRNLVTGTSALPFLARHKHWLADLDWWASMKALFGSCPRPLAALLTEAAAYIQGEGYRPRTRAAIKQKLRNCMEFAAQKAERRPLTTPAPRYERLT